ncbi:MAG: MCE family protein [Nocardioidaceae bacterium]|nr:MCE family protein [Nocardioidaceae bacterium]MCL2611792.1 MCE family protein [Nocardioidaceae bacterium]
MAREVTRNQLARRGLIGLMVIALIGVAITLRSNGTFGSSPHVTALVANAGGALTNGSDVKMNGVIVGKVNNISRAPSGQVAIDLSMTGSDLGHVPSNVVARILPATIFGKTFVDLVVHGQASSSSLRAGDTVKADSTQGTLELQNALDDIDRLVKALGPAELASAIGSAAQALDGRGAEIHNTVVTLNSYLDKLNPQMPKVRSDLQQLASATTVVNKVAPDLLDATDDLLVTANTITNNQQAISALISGGTRLSDTATGFLHRNKRNLVRFINGSSGLLDALYDNRQAGITGAITVNQKLGSALASTVSHGFAQTDAILQLAAPGYYGPGQRPSYRSGGSR